MHGDYVASLLVILTPIEECDMEYYGQSVRAS